MNNAKIRSLMDKHKIKQWQLAEILNINEFTLSRKFRHEIPADEQDLIITKIEDYVRNSLVTAE